MKKIMKAAILALAAAGMVMAGAAEVPSRRSLRQEIHLKVRSCRKSKRMVNW